MRTIESLETLRTEKQGEMEAINQAASDEARTKSTDEREKYEALRDDITAIDLEIQDLKDLAAIAKRAVAVNGTDTKTASDSRSTNVTIRHPAKPEPGIRFAQLAMCLYRAKGDPGMAHNLMQQHYPSHPAAQVLKHVRDRGGEFAKFIGGAAEMRTKAAVDGGTTATGSWTAALLAHIEYSGDFIEWLRPRTVIGQYGMGNIPSLRRIPFNVNIKGQNAGGTGYWAGQGQSKPVTKFGFTSVYHGFKKLAVISVLDDEIIRFSDPSAESMVRDALGELVVATMDGSFVDATAVSASRPAGLLNGVAGAAATGVDHNAIKTDLKALWAAAIAAELDPRGAVYVTTPAIAQSLSLMHGDLSDAPLFPNISLTGGSLLGVPVIVSNHVPAGNFILTFAPEIYLSDDGVVTVDASNQATIEMESEPEAAVSDLAGSPAPATIASGAAFVSMFQTNSVALRAERFVNWSKRRATAVNRVTDVDWGGEAS